MEMQSVTPVSVPPSVSPVQRSVRESAQELNETAASPVQRAVGEQELQNALASVNQVVQVFNKNVEFSVDKSTGIDVVRVVDKESHEVVRQLPIDAVLNFAKTLDTLQGLLVKQRI